MGRDVCARKSLGSLHSRIKESRVLMVGAGGIGCELLKNLVLTGFGEIHIVDLDTIDLSNLNRQFLFGMQHIKKSKAMVAKETAGKFNPSVKLEALHANIKDAQFNVKWFKGFNLVFNALDNLDARKHVNKMCLAADVPLIESGTTGYNGQVQIIKRGETECYDCNPKQVPKSFPVCTIRSTPSQPIHCIVWAKSYLFAEVFGTSEESSPELDPSETSENAQEIANLKREAEELKNIREKMDSPDFAESIFQKVYKRDIDRLRSMEEMWATRTKPEPLEYTAVADAAKTVRPEVIKDDQKKWSLEENFALFADSLDRLAKRMQQLKLEQKDGDVAPVMEFDKDDEDTLDFVAASANLRSSIFGIEVKSKFDIKQMAGNIIPAIATTNAITAGLCVLQAFKILRSDLASGRMIFLAKNPDRVFSAEKLAPPNPNCQTCGVARLALEVDIETHTLGDLVTLLQKNLGYDMDISVLTTELLYDIDFDDSLETPLKQLGFAEETFVTIVDEELDEETQPRVNLVIAVTNNPELKSHPIPIPAELCSLTIPRKLKQPEVPETTPAPTTNGVKRTIEDAELQQQQGAKRIKTDTVLEDREPKRRLPAKDELIVLDDDGAITID